MLAELEPAYSVGKRGCVQSKWTNLLSNKQELFRQRRCSLLEYNSSYVFPVQSPTRASDRRLQCNFQDSYYGVTTSAQGRELAALSQERPLQQHSIVLVNRRSGYWSCVMRQGNIPWVTLGLFLAALRAARPRFSAVPWVSPLPVSLILLCSFCSSFLSQPWEAGGSLFRFQSCPSSSLSQLCLFLSDKRDTCATTLVLVQSWPWGVLWGHPPLASGGALP